jgi:hypothetical protein
MWGMHVLQEHSPASVSTVHGGRKRGAIDLALPPILNRLGIEPDSWELLMGHRGTLFGRAMGKLDAMRLHAATLGQSWVRGVRRAERIYSS